MNDKIETIKIKKKKKFNIINFILTIIIICASCALCFSGYKIIRWHLDNKKNKEIAEKMRNKAEVVEVTDNENTENINPPEELNNPYWDYVKMDLMSVDFTKLLNANKNTVGWIKVEGTTINYPVVQSSNNSYYLSHSFDNSYNVAGWIFMDYRNDKQNFDENTIIYGHSMRDKSMFYTLRNTLNNSWLNNSSYHIVKFSTPYENTLWQVFSVYTISAESYYITPRFNSNEEYIKWLKVMKNRSLKSFDTTVNENDKVLTLSSCYNSNGIRMVLHAKLIKKEAR